MLDLRPAHRFTDTISQRFADEGLRPAYAEASAAFDVRLYDPSELEVGRRAWAARACDEYRSHIGFIHLLSDMAEAGLPFHDLLEPLKGYPPVSLQAHRHDRHPSGRANGLVVDWLVERLLPAIREDLGR